MLTKEIIRRKRAGEALDPAIIKSLVRDFMTGEVMEYQMSAFLMATYFTGMSFSETIALTEAFLESGERIDLSSITGVKVDKHSTGGVGDKVSLLAVPIVAAAGVPVPMISGRALGHTGGTLDKLESIPGFTTMLDERRFRDQLQKVGAVMIGQSDRIVPADRRIYAIRDVTATIEILPFIAASILSKKIAGGADALILDVKAGNGAFMSSMEEAESLARFLVEIADHFGLRTKGFITSMDEPLGVAIGNWLEVVEASDCLKGDSDGDLVDVSTTIAGAMIHAGKKAASIDEGITIARELIRNGLAFEKWIEIVQAQGGDASYLIDTIRYPNPKTMIEANAHMSGTVSRIDAHALGILSIQLGGGRAVATDVIDTTAGIILKKKVGDPVELGEPLCILCSSTVSDVQELRRQAQAGFEIRRGDAAPVKKVLKYFDADTVKEWR